MVTLDPSQAILDEWSLPIPLTAAIVIPGLIYLRGWFAVRETRPAQFPAWRMAAFLSGLATIWIAVGSPMDGFADALLSAHMVEHLLLMSVAPPLLLLGSPQVPLLRGLPRWMIARVLAPLFRSHILREIGKIAVSPVVAWLAMNVIYLAWHAPAAYDFALQHEGWHDFEHICFLSTSILFWWPLIRPWPEDPRPAGWHMLPYLVGADVVNTALSAMLAFCDRPVYRYYIDNPNPFGIPAMTDQIAGAALMWVIGSLFFLVPAVAITMRLLGPSSKLRTA